MERTSRVTDSSTILSIRIPKALVKRLDKAAAKNRRKRSDFLRVLIEDAANYAERGGVRR